MIWKPFGIQKEVLQNKDRIKVLCASKRAAKSEVAYIESIIKAENQPGYIDNGKDPYLMAIIAPTHDMLKRLVWPKFRKFAEPFEKEFNKTDSTLSWNSNNTIIYGISAEKIQRIEGLKLNHVHMTEAFQMGEEVFLEALARVSDNRGTITIDGSLGPNIPNPKQTWIYKTFIEKKFPDTFVKIWTTSENPYFPKDELARLKDTLDPRTYRSMFEISWDTIGNALVYDDFDEANVIRGYNYNPNLETYVSIDWGWAHEMACLYFQYDPVNDIVYCFDEIVGSRMLLDQLWDRMKSKPYRIKEYYCDIAGNQEREQTGRSNVQWFKDAPRNIHFKYKKSAVTYGLTIVRQYIKNGAGQRKFFVDEVKCPKTLDGIRNYSYPEKDGVILNENPIKKDDDTNDSVRYFFVNRLDKNIPKDTMKEFNRWSAFK